MLSRAGSCACFGVIFAAFSPGRRTLLGTPRLDEARAAAPDCRPATCGRREHHRLFERSKGSCVHLHHPRVLDLFSRNIFTIRRHGSALWDEPHIARTTTHHNAAGRARINDGRGT